MKINPLEFGKRLREFRTQQNFTQTDLAEILETTQGNIGHIENGRRKPGADLLLNLYIHFPEVFEFLLLGRNVDQVNTRETQSISAVNTKTPLERFLLKYQRSSAPWLEELRQTMWETLNPIQRALLQDSQNAQNDSN